MVAAVIVPPVITFGRFGAVVGLVVCRFLDVVTLTVVDAASSVVVPMGFVVVPFVVIVGTLVVVVTTVGLEVARAVFGVGVV